MIRTSTNSSTINVGYLKYIEKNGTELIKNSQKRQLVADFIKTYKTLNPGGKIGDLVFSVVNNNTITFGCISLQKTVMARAKLIVANTFPD